MARASSAGLLSLSIALGAAAQSDRKALAETLFQDGRDLLAQGKTAEACAKFASSQRIEPKLGTLLNLATCHEAEGKTASAWAEFTEAAVQAERTNQTERYDFARDHAQALSTRLSRISIAVEADQRVTIAIDGVEIDRAALGGPFPVDPGERTLSASAPGKKTWSARITVPEGPATTAFTVPLLESEPVAPTAEIEPVAKPAPLPLRSPERPPPDRSTERTLAFVAFGVAAAGIGVGSYYGLRALSKKNDAESVCDDRFCETQQGVDDFDAARRYGNISTVAFGVGLVALGAGTYLLLSARSGRSQAARRRTLPAQHPLGFSF